MKIILFGMGAVVIPFCMGLLPGCFEKKKTGSITEAFIRGYIIMWALMQFITVPVILGNNKFSTVQVIFQILTAILALAGILGSMWVRRKRPAFFTNSAVVFQTEDTKKRNSWKRWLPLAALWLVFLGTVGFQLYQSYTLAYADGDDAFYIPLSVSAQVGDSMYLANPYTGKIDMLDVRHGLGPFPMWITYLAKMAHVNAGVMAQSLIPLVLIPLTYCIYLEIGKLLLGEKKTYLSLFMIFISVLQIWGNYSIYTASTFLLTRSRQGKEALANVVIPFLLLLLLQIAGQIKEKGKPAVSQLILLGLTGMAACLCSTMGSFLMCMLTMLGAGMIALCYHKWNVLWKMFLGCVPAIGYALLYLKLK